MTPAERDRIKLVRNGIVDEMLKLLARKDSVAVSAQQLQLLSIALKNVTEVADR